jgi:hypothetical protein
MSFRGPEQSAIGAFRRSLSSRTQLLSFFYIAPGPKSHATRRPCIFRRVRRAARPPSSGARAFLMGTQLLPCYEGPRPGGPVARTNLGLARNRGFASFLTRHSFHWRTRCLARRLCPEFGLHIQSVQIHARAASVQAGSVRIEEQPSHTVGEGRRAPEKKH